MSQICQIEACLVNAPWNSSRGELVEERAVVCNDLTSGKQVSDDSCAGWHRSAHLATNMDMHSLLTPYPLDFYKVWKTTCTTGKQPGHQSQADWEWVCPFVEARYPLFCGWVSQETVLGGRGVGASRTRPFELKLLRLFQIGL